MGASHWPASCKGVLTVVATDDRGKRWINSNSTTAASAVISAPGASVFSLYNPGTQLPVAGDAYAYLSGTSMAAAHVSGIASLVLAVRPTAKPAEIIGILTGSTRRFPALPAGQNILGDCATGGCGPGIVDAAAAVANAKSKLASSSAGSSSYPVHGLALMPDGRVVAWGSNDSGQLGDGTLISRNHAERVPGLTGIRSVLAVNRTSFAVAEDGRLFAWGRNAYTGGINNYAFGVPDPLFTTTPQVVGGLPPIRSIESAPAVFGIGNEASYLAVAESGQVWIWPRRFPTVLSAPTLVPGLSGVIAGSVGQAHFLALKSDGTVWAWGSNQNGQIGNGSGGGAVDTPVPVAGMTDVALVRAGALDSYVIKRDGSLWGWGSNVHGNLGLGDFNMRTSPARLALDRVSNIGEGRNAAIQAVLTDGTSWSWGDGQTTPQGGQLLDTALYRERGIPVVAGDGRLVNTAGSGFVPGPGGMGYLNIAYSDLGQTDLAVTFSASTSNVIAGGTVTYMLTVTNSGPAAAMNTRASIAFAPGLTVQSAPSGCSIGANGLSCNVGNLGSGATVAYSIEAVASQLGDLVATASAGSDGWDYDPDNNAFMFQVSASSPNTHNVPALPIWAVVVLAVAFTGISVRAQRVRHVP